MEVDDQYAAKISNENEKNYFKESIIRVICRLKQKNSKKRENLFQSNADTT